MNAKNIQMIFRFLVAAVWLVNGLVCKLLYLVPRHEAIVARILGPSYADPLTRLIGVAEIGMAIWVISGRWVRVSAATQIALIGIMNVLEIFIAPDLLLWKQFNILFAGLFMGLIYWYGFKLSPPIYRSQA